MIQARKSLPFLALVALAKNGPPRIKQPAAEFLGRENIFPDSSMVSTLSLQIQERKTACLGRLQS